MSAWRLILALFFLAASCTQGYKAIKDVEQGRTKRAPFRILLFFLLCVMVVACFGFGLK